MMVLLREIGLLALALFLAAAATFAAGFWEARFFDLLALGLGVERCLSFWAGGLATGSRGVSWSLSALSGRAGFAANGSGRVGGCRNLERLSGPFGMEHADLAAGEACGTGVATPGCAVGAAAREPDIRPAGIRCRGGKLHVGSRWAQDGSGAATKPPPAEFLSGTARVCAKNRWALAQGVRQFFRRDRNLPGGSVCLCKSGGGTSSASTCLAASDRGGGSVGRSGEAVGRATFFPSYSATEGCFVALAGNRLLRFLRSRTL